MSEEFALGGGEGDDFSVDFSEAVEFLVVDSGWYHVVVEDAKKGKTSNGNACIKARMKIQEEHGDWAGQNLFANWMLGGRGAGFTKNMLQAVYGEKPKQGGRFSLADILGAHMEIYNSPKVRRVEDGGDGSEKQNNVVKYRPWGGLL